MSNINLINNKFFNKDIMVLCEKTNNLNLDIIYSVQRFIQIYSNALNEISKVHVVCSYNMEQINKINIPDNIFFYKAGKWQEKKGFIRLLYHSWYFLRLLKTSIDIIKKENNVLAVMNETNHQTVGVIAFFVSKLTGRECIIRITNDNKFNIFRHNKKMLSKYFYTIVMQMMDKFVINKADVLISVCPLILEKYPQYEYKLCIIPASTPALKLYCHKEIVKKTVGKYFHILFVGRLEPIKGVDILLEALVGLKDVKCSIVGTGSMKHYLQRKVIELQLQDTVYFYGLRTQEEVFQLMEKSDLFVLPSYSEYSPNVVVEAAVIGSPIIASNVGGIKYLIKHKETGLLFRKGDVLDLRKKISFMLNNPETRANFMKKAKKETCLLYSPTIINKEVKKLFKILHNTRIKKF